MTQCVVIPFTTYSALLFSFFTLFYKLSVPHEHICHVWKYEEKSWNENNDES